jgi:hypothetical protein
MSKIDRFFSQGEEGPGMNKLVVALTAVMFVLLASPLGVSAYSNPASNSSHDLQLSVSNGIIQSAGNQHWTMSGGSLVGGIFAGEILSHVDFALSADVTGLTASGTFSLGITGADQSGNRISFQEYGAVVGYVPSICFPTYTVPMPPAFSCSSADTSGIPAFFEVALSSGNAQSQTTSQTEVLLVESPILNPFGGPIVIDSTDGTIKIVATYRHADATWQNVQLAGALSGTLGTSAVSGMFTQTVNAKENFVAGTEKESGSITFMQMTPTILDMTGTFRGHSTVPTGGIDCSAALGLPEGTCMETGLNSLGHFHLSSGTGASDPTLRGKYSIVWPAPSIMFTGSITGHLHPHGDGQGNQNGQGGNGDGQEGDN